MRTSADAAFLPDAISYASISGSVEPNASICDLVPTRIGPILRGSGQFGNSGGDDGHFIVADQPWPGDQFRAIACPAWR
jgi:hypothetical protein